MTANTRSLRSKLAIVRGLGSARLVATPHWVAQRLSALGLMVLSLWFLYGLVTHVLPEGGAVEAAYGWISHPFHGSCMILLVWSLYYHGQLGLQVIIEDYVHQESIKITSLILLKGLSMFLTTLGVVCVLAIMFHAA